MKRTIRFTAAGVVAFGLLAWSPSAPSASQRFTSCDQMHKVFKYGIAKDQKSQKRAVKEGMYRPSLKPSVYAASYKTLDRDKDGVMCEVPK